MLSAIWRLAASENWCCSRGKAAARTRKSASRQRIDNNAELKCGSAPYLVGVAFGAHHGLAVHVVLRLVVEDAEAAHPRVRAGVRPVLASFVSPVLRNHDFVDGSQHIHLQLAISASSSGETRRSIDLDEPRFAGIVDEDIESV